VKKFLSALVLAAALAGLSQALPVVKPAPVPARPAVKTPDIEIEHNIRLKFAKSKINAEHFTVSVQNGVATIDGKTNVIQHKGVATRLAKSGGATLVRNRIQISEEARAKAAARLAQGRGETQIARATVLPAATASAKTK
jgi:hypothetical protein